MVVHPGTIDGLAVHVPDYATALVLESLAVVYRRAGVLEMPLCIENMFPSTQSLVEPEDFHPVFEAFPALRMTLDIAHAHIQSQGGRRALDFIERLGDRIEHIHASDNFGREDNHLPVGAGTVEFRKILKALKKTGYDKTITLEVFSRDLDYLRISREKFIRVFANE